MKPVLIISSVLVCIFIPGFSQPESGVHFLEAPQAAWTNPVFNKLGWQMALPSGGFGLLQPTIKVRSAISKTGGQRILDLNKLDLPQGQTGQVMGQGRLETFLLSHRVDSWSWAVGHVIQGDLASSYPIDVLRLAIQGNASSVGRLIDLRHQIEGTAKHKFSAGAGFHRSKFEAALRLNYYRGLYHFQSDRTQGIWLTDSLGYGIELDADLAYSMAGQWGYYEPSTKSWKSDFHGAAGAGWGVDVGFQLTPTPQWSVAGSVLDVGRMRWKNNSQRILLDHQWQFRGIEIIPPFDERTLSSPNILDTIQDQIKVSPGEFTSALPAQLYLSSRYKLNNNWEAGALFAQNMRGTLSMTLWSLRLAYAVQSKFTTSASINYFTPGGWQLGWHGSIKLGPNQIFVVTDNLWHLVNPGRFADGFHIRIGAALTFGQSSEVNSGVEPRR